jgi:hypothetical protein
MDARRLSYLMSEAVVLGLIVAAMAAAWVA